MPFTQRQNINRDVTSRIDNILPTLRPCLVLRFRRGAAVTPPLVLQKFASSRRLVVAPRARESVRVRVNPFVAPQSLSSDERLSADGADEVRDAVVFVDVIVEVVASRRRVRTTDERTFKFFT